MRSTTHDDGLDALLERHYDGPGPREPFAHALRDQVTRELRPSSSHRLRWLLAGPVGLAACLAMSLTLQTTPIGQAHSLADQATAAIERSRTVHVIGQELRDGHLAETAEAWYVQGLGTVEVGSRQGLARIRSDDGQSDWRYHLGDIVDLGPDEFGPIHAIAETLNIRWLDAAIQRDTACDRRIDDMPCQAYAVTSGNSTTKVLIWLDDDKRIRQFERRTYIDQGWQTTELANVRYNATPGRFRMFADFAPRTQVLDIDQPLAERFSLATARTQRTVGDRIFAVHELTRCEDGLLFVACSVRPTQPGPTDTRDHDAPTDRMTHWNLTATWQPNQDDPDASFRYDQWQLAQLTTGQTAVAWYVLRPDQPPANASDAAPADGQIHLALTSAAIGTPQAIATLPFPQAKLSLAYVVAQVYSDTALVQHLGIDIGETGAARNTYAWLIRRWLPNQLATRLCGPLTIF